MKKKNRINKWISPKKKKKKKSPWNLNKNRFWWKRRRCYIHVAKMSNPAFSRLFSNRFHCMYLFFCHSSNTLNNSIPTNLPEWRLKTREWHISLSTFEFFSFLQLVASWRYKNSLKRKKKKNRKRRRRGENRNGKNRSGTSKISVEIFKPYLNK